MNLISGRHNPCRRAARKAGIDRRENCLAATNQPLVRGLGSSRKTTLVRNPTSSRAREVGSRAAYDFIEVPSE